MYFILLSLCLFGFSCALDNPACKGLVASQCCQRENFNLTEANSLIQEKVSEILSDYSQCAEREFTINCDFGGITDEIQSKCDSGGGTLWMTRMASNSVILTADFTEMIIVDNLPRCVGKTCETQPIVEQDGQMSIFLINSQNPLVPGILILSLTSLLTIIFQIL